MANKYLSAVWDEDLGYLCFEHVRLDFSTHGEVPLVRGKFLPNAFYKEICQIFIPDTFFIFFKFSFFQTKCYSSLCFCNILHGFDTFPYTFLTENMEGKKDKQAWGHLMGRIYVFLWALFFSSNFGPDNIAWDKS